MYYYRLIPLLLIITIVSACGKAGMDVAGPKRMVSSYSEKTFKTQNLPELNIDADSADVEMYSWDRKEVKFEITRKIKGAKPREELQKMLEGFNITCTGENGKMMFRSAYKGKVKSPLDRSIDLKVYLPKKISSVDIRLDTGRIRINDDMKCDLNVEINMANMDINKLEGKLNLTADMCDLRIGSGSITRGSAININMGNIHINAAFEAEGRYSFHTGMGNIGITVPAGQEISFENSGAVEINEFGQVSFPTVMELKSGMGRISIKKGPTGVAGRPSCLCPCCTSLPYYAKLIIT